MKTIKQATLSALLKKRAKLEKLKTEIETAEAAILQSLKEGAGVQAGLVIAEIKSFERRNVSWKTKFVDFVDEVRGVGEGEAMAARIHSSTQPTGYENLSIKLVG